MYVETVVADEYQSSAEHDGDDELHKGQMAFVTW